MEEAQTVTVLFYFTVPLGAIYGEGGGKWEGPGPQTEDPAAVGGLLLICGQDRSDHTGGELLPQTSTMSVQTTPVSLYSSCIQLIKNMSKLNSES